MEKMLDEFVQLTRAHEVNGLAARKQGDIEAARRYFARAEAYAFCAGSVARALGNRQRADEMDMAESLMFRRAASPQGTSYAE
jgi:hypothetical protein